MNNPESWFLAQLKPNRLNQAVRNLERQQIETFMPVRDVSVRRGQRVVMTKQPIFPGYLLVSFDPQGTGWRAINNTYGVSRLVTFGQRLPLPLPKALIMGLKARCDENDCFLPPDDLQVGERVRAISGPFVDFIAKIEEIPDETRVAVLIEIMGRSVHVTMPRHNLERVAGDGRASDTGYP